MVIYNTHFSLYSIIIFLSVIIGMVYIWYELKKEKQSNSKIYLFYIIYITFALIFGKIYTSIVYGESSVLEAGLSAYGGLVGVIIGAIIFEKILPTDGKIIKYSILSLPLVYGLTKIACFITGCCSGIPYNGLFKVIYPDKFNIGQFPIQIFETITFLILFFICNKFKNKKNIIYITLVITTILKFLLDFLRFDHLKYLISRNQIFSIVFLIIVFIVYLINSFKKE